MRNRFLYSFYVLCHLAHTKKLICLNKNFVSIVEYCYSYHLRNNSLPKLPFKFNNLSKQIHYSLTRVIGEERRNKIVNTVINETLNKSLKSKPLFCMWSAYFFLRIEILSCEKLYLCFIMCGCSTVLYSLYIHHALVLKSTHQRADHSDLTKISLKEYYSVKMVLFLFEIQLKTVNQDTGDS